MKPWFTQPSMHYMGDALFHTHPFNRDAFYIAPNAAYHASTGCGDEATIQPTFDVLHGGALVHPPTLLTTLPFTQHTPASASPRYKGCGNDAAVQPTINVIYRGHLSLPTHRLTTTPLHTPPLTQQTTHCRYDAAQPWFNQPSMHCMGAL